MHVALLRLLRRFPRITWYSTTERSGKKSLLVMKPGFSGGNSSVLLMACRIILSKVRRSSICSARRACSARDFPCISLVNCFGCLNFAFVFSSR